MADPLSAALQHALDTRQSLSRLRRLSLRPPHAIDFSSNDYLSLSTSPLLRNAFLSELAAHPAYPLGSGGSRLLDGNSPYAANLEKTIAEFHRAPAGLLFNSGYDANSGVLACLPQPGDVVVYDEFVHASVHEGMRLSRAETKSAFTHNSLESLEAILRGVLEANQRVAGGRSNVFVAVESVYSMDGDLAPLKEMVGIVEKLFPQGNAYFIVDEAHATGVMGECGRGRVCELGIEGKILVRLHTFGKALASTGAIILCTPLLREYLINYCRPLIYTTSLSFPSLAQIKCVYTLLISGQTSSLQKTLHTLITTLHTHLDALPTPPTHILILPQKTTTPILSLLTPRAKSLAAHLQERGFVARAIVFPTVKKGKERVRICVHAGNEEGALGVKGLVLEVEEWVSREVKRESRGGGQVERDAVSGGVVEEATAVGETQRGVVAKL